MFNSRTNLKNEFESCLLVLYSAPRGFLRVLRFPFSSKTKIWLIWKFQFTVTVSPISAPALERLDTSIKFLSFPFYAFLSTPWLKNVVCLNSPTLFFYLNSRVAWLERISYDLEKVFAICFTDQCLATLKQSVSLFPPRKLLIWAVNSSIAQSHYCTNQMTPKRNADYFP